MTKLGLAMMYVCVSTAALAGCSTSTMPAPNDPSTAIHEEPVASNESVTPVPQHKPDLTASATASK